MTADEHLAELKRIATARLRATRKAAEHEGLALVDAKRLAALEELLERVKAAAATAKMTRDYKDVQTPGDGYNGKRYLLRREEFRGVLEVVAALDGRADLPAGCFAGD